jgi:DNA (cytosine-5)-methyltransferase 1
MTLTVGSLFAGIGGLELGLERTNGFKTLWQVEQDPYACRVLAKHWPDVRRYDDVRTFPPGDPAEWRCDVICGGFPCQDISSANANKQGLAGERSGLWVEFARIIRVVRPRYVVVENVSDIVHRGLGRVLGDLAELGFDARWSLLPACALGAPYTRERMFVVAHADGRRREGEGVSRETGWEILAGGPGDGVVAGRVSGPASNHWQAEPGVVRVADGVPSRVDRIRCLGNAVVPAVAEHIGRQLLRFISEFA